MNLLAESSGCPLPDHNTWRSMIARDPEHSVRYAQRWRDLHREGKDLDGEARLVESWMLGAGPDGPEAILPPAGILSLALIWTST
ncbi:hypothetical protein [Auritidibacter ignavus]|uniref:hypothetical protein n=1 Tax=Auritidibacter ignavus TaxID=678932 RepID=UPI003133C895